jgi:hypothetical protein
MGVALLLGMVGVRNNREVPAGIELGLGTLTNLKKDEDFRF